MSIRHRFLFLRIRFFFVNDAFIMGSGQNHPFHFMAPKNMKINIHSEIKNMLIIEEAYSSHCMHQLNFNEFLYKLLWTKEHHVIDADVVFIGLYSYVAPICCLNERV